MRYAGINPNDFSAAPGVSVSFFTQGCPHRCPGCHNPETWDFNGGKKFDTHAVIELEKALTANNIKRNFCLMGGEPLCKENLWVSDFVIQHVRTYCPESPIYIWTGYTLEELLEMNNPTIINILSNADYLIDGPYKQELRDITLSLRGSSNQRVINLKNIKIYDII